jgi:hypothetical protein
MKNAATEFNPKSPNTVIFGRQHTISLRTKRKRPTFKQQQQNKKKELINWLYAHNIPHFNEMLKPQFRLIPVQV